MFLKNIELKIISVILALFLWFIVVTSDYQEVTFNVPIVLSNLDEGLIAVFDTSIARVTLKGPSYLLKTISYNDIKVKIDADNLRYGKNRYAITFYNVLTPKGVEVVKVEPKFVIITIDKMIEKKVKVIPVIVGSPKIGFKLKRVNVNPEMVTIKGAEKSVSHIKVVETLPIDIKNRFRDLTYNIPIKKDDGIMEVSPSNVEVYIEFIEDIVTKTLELPIEVIGPQNYQIKLLNKNVKVKIKGRSDLVNSDRVKKAVKLFIDVSDIVSTGRYLKKVYYKTSDDFKIIKISPDKLRIEVVK